MENVKLWLRKFKKAFSNKYILGLTLLLLILGSIGTSASLDKFTKKPAEDKQENYQKAQPQQAESEQQVLARNIQAPQIYIYGGERSFSSGGMIAIASTDEPAVQIGGYNISGSAEIAVYKADEQTLLDYLT